MKLLKRPQSCHTPSAHAPLSDPFLQCQHHASLLLTRKQTDTILILGEITLLILAEKTLSVNDNWESVKHMDWTQNCCFVTANLWVNKYASLEKKIKDYTPVALLIGAKLKVAVCGKQSTWTWLIYSMYIYYYYGLLLYSAILCSGADSLHSCHKWFWMSDCIVLPCII